MLMTGSLERLVTPERQAVEQWIWKEAYAGHSIPTLVTETYNKVLKPQHYHDYTMLMLLMAKSLTPDISQTLIAFIGCVELIGLARAIKPYAQGGTGHTTKRLRMDPCHTVSDLTEAQWHLVSDYLATHALERLAAFNVASLVQGFIHAQKAFLESTILLHEFSGSAQPNLGAYKSILYHRVSSLFNVMAKSICKLTEADEEVGPYLTRYAEHIGLAIALLQQTPLPTPPLSPFVYFSEHEWYTQHEGAIGYPLLYARERLTSEPDRTLILNVLRNPKQLTTYLPALRKSLMAVGAYGATLQAADAELQAALEVLRECPSSQPEGNNILSALVDALRADTRGQYWENGSPTQTSESEDERGH